MTACEWRGAVNANAAARQAAPRILAAKSLPEKFSFNASAPSRFDTRRLMPIQIRDSIAFQVRSCTACFALLPHLRPDGPGPLSAQMQGDFNGAIVSKCGRLLLYNVKPEAVARAAAVHEKGIAPRISIFRGPSAASPENQYGIFVGEASHAAKLAQASSRNSCVSGSARASESLRNSP